MKLVTFSRADDSRSVGALDGESVVDLAAAAAMAGGAPPGAFTDMVALVAGGERALDAARRLVESAPPEAILPLDAVQLRAPVARPARIRAYSTYRAHAEGCGMTPPPAFDVMPLGYKGNPLAVIGPDEPIPWPAYTDQLDFELELGFYIGRGGVDIKVEDAHRHVAGVTVYNDVSARDIQMYEMSMGTGPAKGKDFCNAMGPCLVTMDAFDDEQPHVASVRVNDEEWVTTTTGGARFTIAEIVAWASYGEPLVPGDFISLGTVGRGCCFELDRWIEPGDVVELSIEGIGSLRNQVGPRQAAPEGSGLPGYRIPPRLVRPA